MGASVTTFRNALVAAIFAEIRESKEVLLDEAVESEAFVTLIYICFSEYIGWRLSLHVRSTWDPLSVMDIEAVTSSDLHLRPRESA